MPAPVESELRVGEVYALRTFRVDTDDGRLVPIAQHAQLDTWADATATARCARGHDHVAPDPGCRCGIYAFGSVGEIRRQYGQGRRLLAVVACHGRLIAGTKGIRAQHARIVALWLSPGMNPALRAQVVARYPQLPIYANQRAMLAEFPPTDLSTYRRPRTARRRWIEGGLFAAALTGAGVLAAQGDPVGERWQAGALLLALTGGAVSLCASLGIRAVGARSAPIGLAVLVLGLAFSVRGMPAGLAAVPLLVIATCYAAVAAWQRIAVRWGPLCDALVPFTPALPGGMAAAERTPTGRDGSLAWRFRTARGDTVVSARYRRVGLCGVRRIGAGLAGAREAVFLVGCGADAFVVTRCRRERRRVWRVVGRQLHGRSEVESALGMAVPRSTGNRRRMPSGPHRRAR